VKLIAFSELYTVIVLGISILLWVLIPRIAINWDIPVFLQHPLFMLEFLSLLSTAIVWIITLPIFTYFLKKGKASRTRSTADNLFIVFLGLVTIIVTVLGSIFWTRTLPYLTTHTETDRWNTIVYPPNPLGLISGIGVLCCEPLWIVWAIYDNLLRLRKRTSLSTASGHKEEQVLI